MITVERRIDWAEQRLTELWAAMDAYLAHEPVDVQVEDAGPGSYVFRGYVREQPPDELSLLVGDFIHNLRASLDNLIWEVAGATASRPNIPSFLIRKTPEEFDRARLRVTRWTRRSSRQSRAVSPLCCPNRVVRATATGLACWETSGTTTSTALRP